MRKHIQNRLKEIFRIALLQTRDEVKLSQEEMAHRLAMATRSYIALENGMSCCSAVTFILFLIYICPDPATFLKELRQFMESGWEAA